MQSLLLDPQRRALGVWLLLSIALLPPRPVDAHVMPCSTDQDCQQAVHERSLCRPIDETTFTNPNHEYEPNTLYCTNPFAEGCFKTLDPEWKQPRVCNSEDTSETIAKCYTPQDLEFMELRLFTHNWESVHLENWLLQIILSEFLNVPTSLEWGYPGYQMNFYHPFRAYDGGGNRDSDSLANAAEYGDCLSIPQELRSPTTPQDDYLPCAHIATEIWSVPVAWEMATQQHIIEAPQGLGVLGEEGWFVPKFTGERDPRLLNYLGLQGEEKRRQLAERFKRPTTWFEYCKEVSINNCTEPDAVALRYPINEGEGGRYFVADRSFTGYFRATEENDCDRFPSNCTGHIADYPCGWTSSVEQQAHHLKIAVRSSGPSSKAQGYEYDSLVEIWHAANHTKSDVLMYWWTPDALVDQYMDSDAEFTRITLPKPTKECVENRVSNENRCHGTQEERWGDERGACDEPSNPLQKVISTGLYQSTHDPSIPEAMRSPAYELAQRFTLDTLQLNDIFAKRKLYSDPRESVCQWAVENKEWILGLLPPGYPRKVEEANQSHGISHVAMALGSLAAIFVLVTAYFSYYYRERQVMKAAQIEFLSMLLVGLFLVAIGSIVVALPATTGSCVSAIWFLMLGYTIELVPLLVKIAAVNHLMSAARGHRRVVLRRSRLFTTVAGISSAVVIYLILWTALDPPQSLNSYIFGTTASSNEDGTIILETTAHCDSERPFWEYIAIVWNFIMLLAGSVLAFQSRNIRLEDYNESATVGFIVYSQSVFVIMRIVMKTALSGTLSEATLAAAESIILAVDVMVVTSIYFHPKFCTTGPRRRQSSYIDFITSSVLDKVRNPSQDQLSRPNNLEIADDIESNDSSCSDLDDIQNAIKKLQRTKPARPCPNCGYVYSSVATLDTEDLTPLEESPNEDSEQEERPMRRRKASIDAPPLPKSSPASNSSSREAHSHEEYANDAFDS